MDRTYTIEVRNDRPDEQDLIINDKGAVIGQDPLNTDYTQYLADIAEDPSCVTYDDQTPSDAQIALWASDHEMPRVMEDIVDAIVDSGGEVAPITKAKADLKKELRSQL